MPGTHGPELLAADPQAAGHAVAGLRGRPSTLERRMADALRALALDAAAEAGSGRTGLPLGMADVATALWTRSLRFAAADPRWPDRDRFVLSAGHGALLLHGLLHLTGHAGMTEQHLRRFCRLDSPATGHPDYEAHPAVEATTGPPGQGLAMGVGMALAERMLAARFGRSLVDHRTWVIASDGDLMEGLAHEAASLAGHLRLDRLAVFWDDNSVSEDGGTALALSADPLRLFAAAGWSTRRIDGHDPAQIAAAIASALRAKRPSLIACRTVMGFAAATPPGGSAEAAIEAARRALDWPHAPFAIPEELRAAWLRAGARGTGARRAWLKRLANHPMRGEFERTVLGRLPESWHEATAGLKAELAASRPSLSTRGASQRALEALSAAIPELTGASADRAGATLVRPPGAQPVAAGAFGGRFLHCGLREHAMAACLNGATLHGGLIPYAGTLLARSDEMRPALRLAAMMRRRAIHVLTHDSIGLGEDGPALQPVEHLAGLRAIPNLHVMRPADALETVECWELAIRRADGPTVLALSCQDLPALRGDPAETRCARGGYVLIEAEGTRAATLIASGSEVALAVAAHRLLARQGIAAAVVSLPCWELFAAQDETYRAAVLQAAPRFGIEAACGFGWERWIGGDGVFIGVDTFGASAPAPDLYRHFGLTPQAIAAAVRKRLPLSATDKGNL